MRKTIVILIAIVLGITPLLTQGNLYFVGGDDMRLYYMYPKEYIQNLLLNIVTDNSIGGGNMGYYPATHPIPLVLLILLVKTLIPANTQFIMYGLNWALAFIFLYLLLGFWIPNKSRSDFAIKILVSLFYIFSPFLTKNLYKHQMIVLFLISAVPGTLYFFIKSVRDRNFLYVFSSALIFSILSTNLSSLPWTVPVLITCSPFIFWEFWQSKMRFLLHTFLFAISYALLNMSWIFHLVNLSVNNTGLINALGTYSSPAFLAANIAGIKGTSTLFSPLNAVINQLDTSLANHISFLSYLNLIFIFGIVLAASFIHRVKNNQLVSGYILGLLGFLSSWFLMTPSFKGWGPELFVWLSLHIPFFTMFRNMFDKFALPMSFFYAVSLGLGLSILASQFKNLKLHLVVGTVLLVSIIANAYPLFQNRIEHVGVKAKMSGEFNDDFTALSNYVSALKNPSRVLWLPLNYPTFVNIEDKQVPGNYYSGPSPLRFLSNRQDYTGQYSFITSTNIAIGDSIFPMIRDKKYADFGRMLQLRNARYVILDKQRLPESMTSYLYGGELRPILEWHTDEFVKGLLGKKLKDFGSRYSIYEINSNYNNDRLYLTDDYDIFPKNLPNLEYQKLSDTTYKIYLKNLKKSQKLVFLDNFYRDWTLYLSGPNLKAYHKGENVPVQDFANGWDINPDEIKKSFSPEYYTANSNGSIDVNFVLYFEPEKFNKPVRTISLVSFVCLGISQLFIFLKKHERKI